MGSDDGLTPTFNDPKGVPAYDLLRGLYRTCDPGIALGEDENKVGGALWDNKAAYQISATWDAKTGTDRGADSFYAPIPLYTGEGAVAANTTVGNLTLSPLANGPNPDLGIAFCEFLGTEEAQWQIAKVRGWVLPTRRSVLEDPNVASSPAYEGYAEKIQVMVDVMLNEELHPTPPFSCNASRIWNAWSDMIGRMFLTATETQELLDWMQNEAETLLNDC
jgi:ABC-type glycerol-3-phosphate transport system substrate-binding protein